MIIPFTHDLQQLEMDPTFREETVAFLRSPAGVQFLELLAAFRPGSNPDRPDFSLGVIDGYEQVFVNMRALLRPAKPAAAPEQSTYPNLDDDAVWKDTEKQL